MRVFPVEIAPFGAEIAVPVPFAVNAPEADSVPVTAAPVDVALTIITSLTFSVELLVPLSCVLVPFAAMYTP
jgi:hypothetical protein